MHSNTNKPNNKQPNGKSYLSGLLAKTLYFNALVLSSLLTTWVLEFSNILGSSATPVLHTAKLSLTTMSASSLVFYILGQPVKNFLAQTLCILGQSIKHVFKEIGECIELILRAASKIANDNNSINDNDTKPGTGG